MNPKIEEIVEALRCRAHGDACTEECLCFNNKDFDCVSNFTVLTVAADLIEQRDTELCAERGNDGADEQGSKKALRHGAHGIDKVAVQIHLDFAFFFGRSSLHFVQSFLFTERERFSGAPVFYVRCTLRRIREKESILTMLPSASVRFRKNAAPPGDSRAMWSQRPRSGGTSAGGRLGYALKNTTNFPCLQGGCKKTEFSIVSFAMRGKIWYTILLSDLRFRPKGSLYIS